MNKFLLSSALGGVVCAATLLSFSTSGLKGQEAKPPLRVPKVQQWEYRALRLADTRTSGGRDRGLRGRKSSSQDALNTLGADGWELVAVREGAPSVDEPVFYFKRPKR